MGVVFSVLSHARRAASRLFSCFEALSSAKTRLFFIPNDDTYHTAACFVCAILLLLLLSFHVLYPSFSSLCVLSYFLFAFLLSNHSVIPFSLVCLDSSLLYSHQLLYTQRRVITFVLHGVSLMGFMPPSSAASAKKRLHFCCHDLSHISGGRIGVESIRK